MASVTICRSILISEGISRAALSHEEECISGYIEYRDRIFSVAIYEYKDIGIIAAKMAPEPYVDVCSETLYDPRGFIAYGDTFEKLCRSLARKIKKYIETQRER